MTRPKKSVKLIDPYVSVDPTIPPTPGSPTGENHLLRIHVPNPDNTVLEMGTGKPSGVRIRTDSNVHLQAGKHTSTISLGDNSTAGFPDGIGISTDGQLKETIKDKAVQEFKNSLHTTVEKGNYTIDVQAGDKVETIVGQHRIHVTKDKNETVDGKLDLTSGPRTETVKGDYKIDTEKNEYTLHARKINLISDEDEFHLLGTHTSVTKGYSSKAYLGLASAQYLGIKAEVVPVKFELCNLKARREKMAKRKITTAVDEIQTTLARMEIQVDTMDLVVSRAAMRIFK